MSEGTLRAVDDRDAAISRLTLRVSGLENEVRKWRARALHAEHALERADEHVCPMAVGDPHRSCELAEALSDTLARAIGRDPTLSDWLQETSEEQSHDH